VDFTQLHSMIVRPVRPLYLVSALMLVLSVPGSGCYEYVPVNPADPPVGMNVRAHLSDPARLRLDGMLPGEGRYLDGRLIQRDGDTFLLEMPVPKVEDGVLDRGLMQRIPLTRDEIVSLQIRKLDRTKTAMAVAVFAVSTAALVVQVFTGKAGGGAYPPPSGGPTEAVIPILTRPAQ
jgi:hypothetical protein